MNPAAPAFPLAAAAMGPLRARAEAGGSGDFSPLWSGQNPTGCMEIPAARLTQELAGYPLAVGECPPATKNAPIDVDGCLNSCRVASG
jgi:hypothetical protein